MNSVTVGMFASEAAANNAKDKLLLAGFANEVVVVSSEEVDTMHTDSIVGTTNVPPVQEPEQKEGAISRFFSSIFGHHGDHPDPYSDTYKEAIRRGHYGVSVNVQNEEELGRAEKILNDCGAIDIDKHAEQWRGEGWVAVGKPHEISETPNAGRPSVARGSARVFSRVDETKVDEAARPRE